jgi:hypothetical protein
VSAAARAGVTFDEHRPAARNHATPLEALRYDLTPVGLHYLLTHYDIPVIDGDRWRLLDPRPLSQPWLVEAVGTASGPALPFPTCWC